MLDLPGHMGRYRVQLELATSPDLQQYFSFQWRLIGNLGVDLLVQLFAPSIGLEPTVKLIVLMIPVLTVGGLLWVAYEVHGRVPPTAFFAVPFAYNFPFLFGFVNFALAMALALHRLRALAAAGAAGPGLAARRLVRADLARPLDRPRLRLGNAGRARFLRRAGPPARPRPLLSAWPAFTPASTAWRWCRRSR